MCPPAEIGMVLSDVDTPALLLDLDVFERNLQKMSEAVADYPVRLRPHAKTHKCSIIALRQIALGAVGVCCQKVSEAEALVYGGVPDVLVTNEIIGTQKLRRLAALARQARVAVCADDPAHVAALSEAARSYDVELSVLVEVNVGADRCGVDPGEPVLTLARLIDAAPRLHFAGLQAYQGAAQHIRDFAKRRAAIEEAVEKVTVTKGVLERYGFSCNVVTGGGTGTYRFEASSNVYTELQIGSYIFMDVDYAANLADDGGPNQEFEHSLFVYSTLMSRPAKDRAFVDAGLKALSVDSGMPRPYRLAGVNYVRASDEHGALTIADTNQHLAIGDKIKLIPGHCDPTVNLYDWYVGIRNERVEALWPINARGRLL